MVPVITAALATGLAGCDATPVAEPSRPAASAPSSPASPATTLPWRTHRSPDGRFTVRYPGDWKASNSRGFVLLRSPDRSLQYELYVEEDTGSFAAYRRDTIESATPGSAGRCNCVVTTEDITVDGRQGFWVQNRSDATQPDDWAGDRWCGGCVERDHYVHWGRGTVLNVSTSGTARWDRYEATVERIVASLRRP